MGASGSVLNGSGGVGECLEGLEDHRDVGGEQDKVAGRKAAEQDIAGADPDYGGGACCKDETNNGLGGALQNGETQACEQAQVGLVAKAFTFKLFAAKGLNGADANERFLDA